MLNLKEELRFLSKFLFATVAIILGLTSTSPRPKSLLAEINDSPKSSSLRLVSLAPSLTESLFALELGQSLVGRSSYCKFPPEAKKLPDLGGVFEPDIERILELKPSHILSLRGQSIPPQVLKNGVKHLEFKQDSLEEILSSLEDLGKELGREEQAKNITADLNKSLQSVTSNHRKSFLLLLSSSTSFSSKLVAGNYNYLSDLLKRLGLENANSKSDGFSPISLEGIYTLNPDVIIELVPPETQSLRGHLESEWSKQTNLAASKNEQIFFFDQEVIFKPGPRVAEAYDLFKEALTIEAK